MPLGTLDRNPPPFFKQGPSAFSKLMVCSALALFLMVADVRFHVAQPLRAVVATALYPFQWVAMRPVLFARFGAGYFESLQSAQASEAQARANLALQSQRANQVDRGLQHLGSLFLEPSRLVLRDRFFSDLDRHPVAQMSFDVSQSVLGEPV